jgi:high affinity Mn2+ porin
LGGPRPGHRHPAVLSGVPQPLSGGAESSAAGHLGQHGGRHPLRRRQALVWRRDLGEPGDVPGLCPQHNRLASPGTKNRLVITAGKLNATDIFDTNKYAHDPRQDFLNWSLITTGSFDYAADAWGYTYGAAVEDYQGDWTWRAGVFDLSIVPNNATLTSDFSQFQLVGEVEKRTDFGGRPGAIRLGGFVTRGRMGRYDDAVSLALATGEPAETAAVRHYRSRPGVYLNVEQEVTDGVGVFGRIGWSDGDYESYEYTDIDRTVHVGVSVSGQRWKRKDDTAALAIAVNALSDAGHRYLNAGGLGILIGDGRLPHPGAEDIVEGYYSLSLLKGMTLSLDDQVIVNPAYNRDRGPVNVVSLRLHLEH